MSHVTRTGWRCGRQVQAAVNCFGGGGSRLHQAPLETPPSSSYLSALRRPASPPFAPSTPQQALCLHLSLLFDAPALAPPSTESYPLAATSCELVSSWGTPATHRRTRSCRGFGTTRLEVSTDRWSFSKMYKKMPLAPFGGGAWVLTRWLLGQIPEILRDCDVDASRWDGEIWPGP